MLLLKVLLMVRHKGSHLRGGGHLPRCLHRWRLAGSIWMRGGLPGLVLHSLRSRRRCIKRLR